MAILTESLEQLKAAPLSKAVEALGGSLKRVGREYVTQCIWHEDTNPSLTINDDKGFCFCHVCRSGGDVIKYVEKRNSLDFVDAANLAASILGVTLQTDGISPEEQARRKKQRQDSINRLQKKQLEYKANLRDDRASRIRDILGARGLKPATSKEFGLGFSPDGFFAGRITIPIHNHKNELVGWTGRATKDQPGKYKNSADSDLFNKKSLVFNEVRAKEAARLAGSLIFVEGHLDVVSLWQHGVANVVAMQGTGAPEPYVLQRLAKAADNFILCFDGDAGGRKAVEQFISAAGPMAQNGEIQINVVHLPEGKDPDEICREQGVTAFQGLIADSIPWLDWVIDFWAADLDKENSQWVTSVETALRKQIDGLRSDALRAHYVDKVARALARDDKDAAVLAKNWSSRTIEIPQRTWEPPTWWQTRKAVERRLLRIYVHCPHHRERLATEITKVAHPPLAWLVERIQELEEYCATDLTPHSIMAVVIAAEPHFLSQLRTIVQPSVNIDDSEGVLQHISDTMSEDVQPEPHELDADQPST